MKKSMLILSSIFLMVFNAFGSDIYCPNNLFCTNNTCAGTPSADPAFSQLQKYPNSLVDGLYPLESIDATNLGASCNYSLQSNGVVYGVNLIGPHLQADWQPDKNGWVCGSNGMGQLQCSCSEGTSSIACPFLGKSKKN